MPRRAGGGEAAESLRAGIIRAERGVAMMYLEALGGYDTIRTALDEMATKQKDEITSSRAQEHEQKGKAGAFLELLETRFGKREMTAGLRSRVMSADDATPSVWLRNILWAPDLDQVFGAGVAAGGAVSPEVRLSDETDSACGVTRSGSGAKLRRPRYAPSRHQIARNPFGTCRDAW